MYVDATIHISHPTHTRIHLLVYVCMYFINNHIDIIASSCVRMHLMI